MIDVKVKREIAPYLSGFAQVEAALPAGDGTWLHGLRKAALARFAELGFPTTRQEAWRLTSLASLAAVPFKPAPAAEPDAETAARLDREALAEEPHHRLVFVNGRFAAGLSSPRPLPAGLTAASLAGVLRSEPARVEPHLARYADWRDHPFRALNTAFIADGAFVAIPAGLVVEEPIHLVFVSTMSGEPTVSHPRNLIVAGPGSQAKIVESYLGFGRDVYFTNAVTELVVGENASVEHCKLQRESEAAFHLATLWARQDRSSTFVSHSVSIGGALVRNELTVVLDAEGAECTLNGLYVATGQQLVDTHTTIDHAKPHCRSDELYKGILGGRAKGIFHGRIVVRPDAQKTDANQTNKNLLLSDDATVDSKPELEINNNDVRCTHGSALGQVDRDAVFYLRARGLTEAAARQLLIQAFVRDLIDRITIVPIRDRLDGLILGRLSDDLAAGRAAGGRSPAGRITMGAV